MKTKYFYIISFLFLILNSVIAQNKTKFLNNSSIRFEIWRQSLQMIDSNKIISTKYFIEINLNNKQRRILKSLSKKDWIRLLNDNNSDWATNLVLYDIYKKDAFLFNSVLKTRNEWILSNKSNDISYWKNF